MFNPSTQKTYYFPCNAWLEKTKEGGLAGCRKELVAGALCVVVVGGEGGWCREGVRAGAV